jgi:hypothetical protein
MAFSVFEIGQDQVRQRPVACVQLPILAMPWQIVDKQTSGESLVPQRPGGLKTWFMQRVFQDRQDGCWHPVAAGV